MTTIDVELALRQAARDLLLTAGPQQAGARVLYHETVLNTHPHPDTQRWRRLLVEAYRELLAEEAETIRARQQQLELEAAA